jgi:glycosyltransferase involved in cell wall biosynthesis
MMTRESLLAACPPGVSVEVIVPVYNEEEILAGQLEPVIGILPENFRIMVVENGSDDGTVGLLEEMSGRYRQLGYTSLSQPNYGLAMKTGLLRSRADLMIIDDLDVLDVDFWQRGLRILGEGEIDLVQGSKVLAGRNDRRPLLRRAATLTLTFLLRTILGYSGTDTHGPKVLWHKSIEGIPEECVLELDIFPTELVIRAQRAGVRIREIPIHLKEIRATPYPLVKRIPRALRDILRLRRSL